MKKILLSLAVIVFVGAIAVGATGAFFSDTETSTGNTFTAGAIDLKIDNDSYYSAIDGWYNEGTSWLTPSDLDGQLFFNFTDLKPGDWGEDTISLHVNNNDAYACVDVRLDSNNDNGLTEPEEEDGDHTDGVGEGELASRVNFAWWVDDGDNVYEVGETLLPAGPLGYLEVGQVATVALAESQGGIFGGPLTGEETYYIGKYWCFGNLEESPSNPIYNNDVDDNRKPNERGKTGFNCDGANEDNKTQTDGMTATISFMAVQSRNNDTFVCESHLAASATGVLALENKDGNWNEIDDSTYGTLAYNFAGETFDYDLSAHGLTPGTSYSLIYAPDPWPQGNGPGGIAGTNTQIASGSANGSGDLALAGSIDLGYDLPHPNDANFGSGAKIWVVLSADHDGTIMTAWHPASYLFEHELITYNDTGI